MKNRFELNVLEAIGCLGDFNKSLLFKRFPGQESMVLDALKRLKIDGEIIEMKGPGEYKDESKRPVSFIVTPLGDNKLDCNNKR